MKVINLSEHNTVLNQYLAELRDENIQNDRARFRKNLARIGQVTAYEISRTLSYSPKRIHTPLDTIEIQTCDNDIILGTIFRAGLPFYEGFLDVFDKAGSAFVSAYRYYKDKECKDVGIKIEYLASPRLTGKTLIIADPMLATGGSMELSYEAFCTNGVPSTVHLCCVIASKKGVDYIKKAFRGYKNVTLWCGAIDPELNEHSYIVPGLGDAGDLAYGEKL